MRQEQPEEIPLEYVTGSWSRTVTQPVAIMILSLSLFLACASVLVLLSELPWFSLSLLITFASLEGIYTSLWLKHPDRRIIHNVGYRAAELVTLLILTRLAVWLISGAGLPTIEGWRLLLRQPLLIFGDGFFIGAAFIVLIIWVLSIRAAAIFAQLAISEAEAAYYAQPRHYLERWADDKPIVVQRPWLVAEFFRQWLWGGSFMIICTALSSVELSEMGNVTNPFSVARLGLRPELLTGLVLYFLAGFWLLSQAKLEVMNARWLINGVRKHGLIEHRWQRGSFLILAAIALAAAFLPIGSTLPIGRILDVVVGLLLYGVNLFIYLIGLFFSFLLSRFAASTENQVPPPAEPPPSFEEILARQSEAAARQPNETAALVVSSLFWTLIIFVAISAIIFFLRERGVRINSRTLRQGWQTLVDWLRLVWRGAETRAAELRRTLQVRRQEPAAEQGRDGRQWRFIRVNALSPREQIRYFYLSVVRRAGDRGVVRAPGETPLEYIQDLASTWPEESSDIEALTDAFLEARYSPRPIQKNRAAAVRATWKQVKASIRRRSRRQDTP